MLDNLEALPNRLNIRRVLRRRLGGSGGEHAGGAGEEYVGYRMAEQRVKHDNAKEYLEMHKEGCGHPGTCTGRKMIRLGTWRWRS